MNAVTNAAYKWQGCYFTKRNYSSLIHETEAYAAYKATAPYQVETSIHNK